MTHKNFSRGIFVIYWVFCFPLSLTLNARSADFDASVYQIVEIRDIPSASGIVALNGSYFIIGDDSPYLFRLDSAFNLLDKIEIYSSDKLDKGRLPSGIKPDFESITVVPWGKDEDLLVFGSGSEKERELMIRIDFDDDKASVKSYSLKGFYKHIAKLSGTNKKLNIEGAGYWNKKLLLLNRADNILFIIDFEDFKKYMRDKDKDFPRVELINIKLPTVNGVSARFSGATVLNEENLLVFSASLENDPNWIVDEQIIGSYLGIMDLNQLENNQPVCKIILRDNQPLQEKVESLYLLESDTSVLKLIGVVDNDDGKSKLLKIDFKKL